MKKTFTVDTSQSYFWFIIILLALVSWFYFNTVEHKEDIIKLKQENEILKSNESKHNDTLIALQDSLKSIKTANTALQGKLSNQKSDYKLIIRDKNDKINTVNSYDYEQLVNAFAKRYDKD